MYMQVELASSILGLCGVFFAPIPVLFHRYGARIRKFSKYVPQT